MLKKFAFLFLGVIIAVAVIRGVPTNISEWGPWAEEQMQDLGTFVNEQLEKIEPEEIIQIDLTNPNGEGTGDNSGREVPAENTEPSADPSAEN